MSPSLGSALGIALISGGKPQLAFSGTTTIEKGASSPDNILTLVVLNNPATNPYDGFAEVTDADNIASLSGDEITIDTSAVIDSSIVYKATSSGGRPDLTITIQISIVDTTAPTVDSIAITSSPAVGTTYGAGEDIEVTVTFTEAVAVTGTPQLGLNIGGSTVQADYASGTGTTDLVFAYTVQSGDEDTDGISIDANSLALNGGTIRDASANNATLTHSAVTDDSNHKVDGIAPSLSSVVPNDDATDVAVDADIVITWDEDVSAGTGVLSLKRTSDDSTIDSWDIETDSGAGAGQFEISGGAVTFHLTTDLDNSEEYYLVWPAGIVTDAVGNGVAAQASTTVYSFTTVAAAAANFPTVVNKATTADFSAASPFNLNLPASIQAGNLLLAFLNADGTNTQAITWPVGWTVIGESPVNSGSARLEVAIATATGAEGATMSLSTDATGNLYEFAAIFQISGWNAVEISMVALGVGLSWDSSSLTPSWGSKKTLWFAVAGQSGADQTLSSYPANYTGNQTTVPGSGDERLIIASRELEATSDDPGAFVFTGSNQNWAAYTIAVEPA